MAQSCNRSNDEWSGSPCTSQLPESRPSGSLWSDTWSTCVIEALSPITSMTQVEVGRCAIFDCMRGKEAINEIPGSRNNNGPVCALPVPCRSRTLSPYSSMRLLKSRIIFLSSHTSHVAIGLLSFDESTLSAQVVWSFDSCPLRNASSKRWKHHARTHSLEWNDAMRRLIYQKTTFA